MKIRWYDRLLVTISALLLITLGAFLIMTVFPSTGMYSVGQDVFNAFGWNAVSNGLASGNWIVIASLIVVGLLLIAWGVRQILSLAPKKKRQSFFNATELPHGRLSISLTALEHLVNKCIGNHTEFTDSHIRITGDEDKAKVAIKSTITGGISMPKSTEALQKEIVSHLGEYAGIQVSAVDVVVEDTRLNTQLPAYEPKRLTEAERVEPIAEPYIEPILESDFRQARYAVMPDETPQPAAQNAREEAEDEAANIDTPVEYKDEPTIEDAIESVAAARLEDEDKGEDESGEDGKDGMDGGASAEDFGSFDNVENIENIEGNPFDETYDESGGAEEEEV